MVKENTGQTTCKQRYIRNLAKNNLVYKMIEQNVWMEKLTKKKSMMYPNYV